MQIIKGSLEFERNHWETAQFLHPSMLEGIHDPYSRLAKEFFLNKSDIHYYRT